MQEVLTELIPIDWATMLAMSIVVLFAGMYLTRYIPFLADNYIPPAVTGGLLFCLLSWVLYTQFGIVFAFDLRMRDLLLLVFFATVGLGAEFSTLRRGGLELLILTGLAGLFLLMQNSIGVGMAKLLDVAPGYGLMAGSVSLAGGHGTAAAWGLEAEAAGLDKAIEVGLIFATFGLVAGGLLGGPLARFLVSRYQLSPSPPSSEPVLPEKDVQKVRRFLIEDEPLYPILRKMLVLALCVTLGDWVNRTLLDNGLMLPGFLTTMMVAIVLTNLLGLVGSPNDQQQVQRVGDLSLNLFLTMSMMTLQLWVLAGNMATILLVMALQIIAALLFSAFLVFRFMGRNYDAAVMSAGFTGLGLGATPVALANMDAVTRRFGPSPRAFIIVPLIGAFFIDLLNAGVIEFFIRVFGKL